MVYNYAAPGSTVGIQAGNLDGQSIITGRRATPSAPTPPPPPPPAPAPVAPASIGDLREQLATLVDQIQHLATTQATSAELAEQITTALAALAAETRRDEPDQAHALLDQVREHAQRATVTLAAAGRNLEHYAAGL